MVDLIMLAIGLGCGAFAAILGVAGVFIAFDDGKRGDKDSLFVLSMASICFIILPILAIITT